MFCITTDSFVTVDYFIYFSLGPGISVATSRLGSHIRPRYFIRQTDLNIRGTRNPSPLLPSLSSQASDPSNYYAEAIIDRRRVSNAPMPVTSRRWLHVGMHRAARDCGVPRPAGDDLHASSTATTVRSLTSDVSYRSAAFM